MNDEVKRLARLELSARLAYVATRDSLKRAREEVIRPLEDAYVAHKVAWDRLAMELADAIERDASR